MAAESSSHRPDPTSSPAAASQAVTPLAHLAAGMHELFLTLMDAGFEREDALSLVAKITTESQTRD